MPWQVSGTSKVHDWLARTPDPAQRTAMLTWLKVLVEKREHCAISTRPGPGIPTYLAQVPGTDAFVVFSVVDQYHAVVIAEIIDAPAP